MKDDKVTMINQANSFLDRPKPVERPWTAMVSKWSMPLKKDSLELKLDEIEKEFELGVADEFDGDSHMVEEAKSEIVV